MQHGAFRRINYIPSIQKMDVEGSVDATWMVSLRQWRSKISGNEFLITPASIQQLQGLLSKGPVSRLKNIVHVDGRSGLSVVKQDSILKLPDGRLPSSARALNTDIIIYGNVMLGSDCSVEYHAIDVIGLDFHDSRGPGDAAVYLECLGLTKGEGQEAWTKTYIEFLFDGFGRLMAERKLHQYLDIEHQPLDERDAIQPVRVLNSADKLLTEVAVINKADAMHPEGWLRPVYEAIGNMATTAPKRNGAPIKRISIDSTVYKLDGNGLLIKNRQWPPSQRFTVTFQVNKNEPAYTYVTPEEGCFTARDDCGNIYLVAERMPKDSSVLDRMELVVESKGGRVVAARHSTGSHVEDHFRMVNYDLMIDAYNPPAPVSLGLPIAFQGLDRAMFCMRCMKQIRIPQGTQKVGKDSMWVF